MSEKKHRSTDWFGKEGKDGFIYRAWMKNQGFPPDEFDGKPVIGICNTWSELTPCNAHLRDLAEAVKRGIWEAGGLPLEFPVMSLGETLIRPTAMLYRNLVSMDVEESIRANPLDGVVLMCGCDKTTPSLVMGACSVDIPSIVVSGGPMLTGKFKGEDIGTTDVWRFAEEYKVGALNREEFRAAEGALCRSAGHCAVMGTASTMASMVESLGLSLPGNAAIPAVDARRKVLAHRSGRRIVEMVDEELTPSAILSRDAFVNAVKVNAAIGGSTNFIVHLMAIARRIGAPLELDDFDRYGSEVPLLVNLKPSGEYHMEEFYYAGGLPAVIAELEEYLNSDIVTANGKTLADNNRGAPCYNRDVIASVDDPFQEEAGITVVRGNLCPEGAVIKTSAASEELLQHRGPAVVFENIEDYHARIDDPDLEVDEDSVLVLKYVGPKGYPGMAEVGNMGLPRKILDRGVKDMVRISDGRMSGTAYGTAFLHVAPESYAGGNLALVQNGDMIEVDVKNKRLHLDVPEKVLEQRRADWNPPVHDFDRGYVRLYIDHVEQAHLGADMDFLVGSSGGEVKRESH
ncbi:IlvD/Edd family dehydratase [Fodinibius sediminis]|uniref:Dihydroxyacid dehydratase n=1 Tax=Fodinibius sediminis TaxID=1214077 RepID=A0A521BJP8_9BACT|nr:IlvD/Edd family dehydratase [Fodinibius sediminis]SMO46890.1 dihydroxyacid dehydratase [Fodinibius sediminis]